MPSTDLPSSVAVTAMAEEMPLTGTSRHALIAALYALALILRLPGLTESHIPRLMCGAQKKR